MISNALKKEAQCSGGVQLVSHQEINGLNAVSAKCLIQQEYQAGNPAMERGVVNMGAGLQPSSLSRLRKPDTPDTLSNNISKVMQVAGGFPD